MDAQNIPARLSAVADKAKTRTTHVLSELKRRRALAPLYGYVEGLDLNGGIRGWVFNKTNKDETIEVGLYCGEALIERARANLRRDDVHAKTNGPVRCGFQLPFTETHLLQIPLSAQSLSVRSIGSEPRELGTIALPQYRHEVSAAISETSTEALRIVLKPYLKDLLGLLDDLTEAERAFPSLTQPPFRQHQLMFTTEQLIPDVPENTHPAYLDYVRYRYRENERFDVATGMESEDRFLYWYLTTYRGAEKRRVPLSKAHIDHLNAPIVMGGHDYTLSRVLWWRLSGRPDLLASLDLSDRDGYFDILFWWAHQDVPHMNFEDCLVPDRFADLLAGVHPSRRLDKYPLTYFTERFFRKTPALQFLKPGTDEGREHLLLAMMVMAARRPDLLRYMPRTALRALLTAADDGQTPFGRFVDDLLVDEEGQAPLRLGRADFGAALRKIGFDLDSMAFMTRDQNGNRFEGAALRADMSREMVDVQLIGPLAKASGLGQATRLSADILRETGLNVRGVDFDLDNPAPEGFSSDTLIEDYGPAKINMIHLNAESTPLAFAYQPDVFSNSYNIGYFFWELDEPAYCHYLGMEMLDEIWVSTEYGVNIYKPDANGKPVVNVGMCFEPNDDIDKAAARQFVHDRFRFTDEHFVCLVAFDSFSFVQRKNPVGVLKAFQKAFEGVPNARLIVKTQNRDAVFDKVQVNLWDQVEALIANDSRIVILNETLRYRDLLQLKAGSDCYISLHKSEGWGFGMIEAMSLKVPVVCTAYSGNMDFSRDDTCWLVDYEEKRLQHGDYIFIRPESHWAEPSVEDAARQLRACYDQPDQRAARAENAYTFINENFSAKAIAKRYGGRLKQILSDLEAEH